VPNAVVLSRDANRGLAADGEIPFYRVAWRSSQLMREARSEVAPLKIEIAAIDTSERLHNNLLFKGLPPPPSSAGITTARGLAPDPCEGFHSADCETTLLFAHILVGHGNYEGR
jgi:hypothetical protein